MASMRAFLQARGLDDYQVYYCNDIDHDEIDRHRLLLGGDSAQWEASPRATSGGELFNWLHLEEASADFRQSGAVYLSKYQVAVLRWMWLNAHEGGLHQISLCA